MYTCTCTCMYMNVIYNRLEAHEDINNDFYKYYKWIEFNLPMKLKEMDKPEIWKHFCNIYQVLFQCYNYFIYHLSLLDILFTMS